MVIVFTARPQPPIQLDRMHRAARQIPVLTIGVEEAEDLPACLRGLRFRLRFFLRYATGDVIVDGFARRRSAFASGTRSLFLLLVLFYPSVIILTLLLLLEL